MADKKEKSGASVRSAADVAKAWKTAEAEIARERKNREKKGEVFVGLSKEEFEQQMKRVDSPVFIWEGWNNQVTSPGTVNYTVGVLNPDPFTWSNLALSISIGNRNPIVSNDEFLTTFDARFPTYAKPQPFGFTLASQGTMNHSFAITIPAGIEKAGYFGNTVLQQLSFFGVGKYLGRAVFFFEVVPLPAAARMRRVPRRCGTAAIPPPRAGKRFVGIYWLMLIPSPDSSSPGTRTGNFAAAWECPAGPPA